MAVDHKKKILFIHPSKCAGKSIETSLFGFGKMAKSDHKKVSDYSEKILSEYFVFSFVRNPWDRVISALSDASNRIDPKRFNMDKLNDHLKAYFSKSAKVATIVGGGMLPCDQMFLDNHGKNRVSWVGRYENLEEDWKDLCKIINEKISLPHINKSNERNHYSTYYDDESIELVREIFSWEIKEFGYRFEDKR
jgi:hypothetical protein